MYSKKNIALTVILIICILIPTALFAQSTKEIMENMDERLPLIIEMKGHGIIGEDFNGYLAFVTENKPNQDIIESENIDRKIIYSLIAAKEEVTLEFIEKHRAKKIAENANTGEFLQNEDGSWYQK
jgi:uncharacterized protein YdbL (DUF1318 family)